MRKRNDDVGMAERIIITLRNTASAGATRAVGRAEGVEQGCKRSAGNKGEARILAGREASSPGQRAMGYGALAWGVGL